MSDGTFSNIGHGVSLPEIKVQGSTHTISPVSISNEIDKNIRNEIKKLEDDVKILKINLMSALKLIEKVSAPHPEQKTPIVNVQPKIDVSAPELKMIQCDYRYQFMFDVIKCLLGLGGVLLGVLWMLQ